MALCRPPLRPRVGPRYSYGPLSSAPGDLIVAINGLCVHQRHEAELLDEHGLAQTAKLLKAASANAVAAQATQKHEVRSRSNVSSPPLPRVRPRDSDGS